MVVGLRTCVCLCTTPWDPTAQTCLTGSENSSSEQEVSYPPLSQDLCFLSTSGWFSEILIITTVTSEESMWKWESNHSFFLFPFPHSLYMFDTMEPSCFSFTLPETMPSRTPAFWRGRPLCRELASSFFLSLCVREWRLQDYVTEKWIQAVLLKSTLLIKLYLMGINYKKNFTAWK